MKLAKCDFCGGSPDIINDVESAGFKDFYFTTYVLCASCKSRGPVFCDFDFPSASDRLVLATKGWNKIHDREEFSK